MPFEKGWCFLEYLCVSISDRTKDFRPDTERDFWVRVILAESRYSADRILSAESGNFGRYYLKATKFCPKLAIKVYYFVRYALFGQNFSFGPFGYWAKTFQGASEVISIGWKLKERFFVRSLNFTDGKIHQLYSFTAVKIAHLTLFLSMDVRGRPGKRL